MKPNFPKKQAGMGMAGWMFIVFIFGSVLTVGMKLMPPFLDHNTMSNILDGLAEEDGLAQKRDYQIEAIIKKRFKMNNIRDFKIHENLEIKRTRNGVEIVMDYEVRMNLIKNVDLITSFDKSVELRN
ncbi:MAG: DUF4845 domain-containing protein [Proteobacteria bacterium]|nr:DUF4845 domain-containing protein [Pseudomonadota bacterium]